MVSPMQKNERRRAAKRAKSLKNRQRRMRKEHRKSSAGKK